VIKLLSEKNLPQAAARLAERDPLMASLLSKQGVPPLWTRPQGMATLVKIILEQQVSLAAAATAYQRLVDDLGELTPARLLAAGVPHLRQLGLTRQKSSYCVNLAEAIQQGRLDLPGLSHEDDSTVIQKLTSIKGIGPWTAQIYLLMALRRADSWPAGDLALVSALRQLNGPGKELTAEQLLEQAERWRPYRAVAARLIWQYYLDRKNCTDSA
jgi:DNA-3-methyladenine glycosylase II